MISPKDIDVMSLPFVFLSSKENLPTTKGVYFAVNVNDEIVYVGKASNFLERWENHHKLPALSVDDTRIFS